MALPAPLSRESLGHLAYLHRVLTGGPAPDADIGGYDSRHPPSAITWEGFYTPQSDAMNFGLRFQLAFATYAVAALGQCTPAYTRPYIEAIGAAIERMRDVRAWGYWRPAPAAADGAPAGHVAVLLTPHARATGPQPPPADPVEQDNVQFSGHLGTMLGLYERAGGDDRYDRGFDLADPASGVRYPYTHGAVAARIVEQMRANYFHGVACEPACAYVPCNNHAMTCNAIHDATHGTDYAAANADWLAWVRRKMVLRGSALRGLFGACFLRDVGLAAPVAFQFTDSWGLAFLLPFDRALGRRLYRAYRGRLSTDPEIRLPGEEPALYVGSAPLCEKMEISDVALNTAFGLIVARGLGDARTAARLAAYVAARYPAAWTGPELAYRRAPRTLHTTAIYALATLVEGSGTLERLFAAPRDPALAGQPCLDQVEARTPDGGPAAGWARHAGIAEAAFDPAARTLTLAVDWLGPAPPPGVVLRLVCARMPAVQAVQADGAPAPPWTHDPESGRLTVEALPGRRQRLVVQLTADG